HCKADAVQHEPCGLLGDSQSAVDFVGTDSVLAVRNHPHSDKPLIERDCGIFHDGSDLRRELFARMLALALPEIASREEAHVFAGASWTGDTVGPAALDHERATVVGVPEIEDGLLKCSGLLHGCLRCLNTTKGESLSQVYYRLHK